DREPEDLPTDLHQPLVPDVMAFMEVAQQRLDPGPEPPGALQHRRISPLRPRPSSSTAGGILPPFDDHRPDRRQLDHLTPPNPPPAFPRPRLPRGPAGRPAA